MNTHHIWDPDTRIADIGGDWKDLSASQIPGIRTVWEAQQERLKGSPQLSDFTERLNREWAIETGVIENVYQIERGITETLIEHGFRADLISHGSTNKPHEFVLQLLHDHKDALEGIFSFVKSERRLSTSYVRELHSALLRNQKTTEARDSRGNLVEIPLVTGEWKTQPNHPVRNGVLYRYCPPEHVAAEMDRLIEMHNRQVDLEVSSEVQAAWLHHRFTQIHPFQDGNGRVARAIASLVLIKDGLFPMVVTRRDKSAYIAALEEADGGSLHALVELIAKLQVTRFGKASAIQEVLREKEDVQAALDAMGKAADRLVARRRELLKVVFRHAESLEDNLEGRLNEISSQVQHNLRKISPEAKAFVMRSNEGNDYYYRSQILANAKLIDYFANLSEYRSWVAMKMNWSRRGQLVFAIHGIGRYFSGGLICAPFLEFKDTDEGEELRPTAEQIVEEGFVFFHNENQERMLKRFSSWREKVLKIALVQITNNMN